MPSVAKQLKPLLLKVWWVSKRSPAKSIFCYFILPMMMMGICLTMSWLMFGLIDVTDHSKPYFATNSLVTSPVFRACSSTASKPASVLCGVGVAVNVTVYPGSTSEEQQRKLFDSWVEYFRDSWELQILASFSKFNSSQALSDAYASPDSYLIGGVVVDFSQFPSHVSTDIRVSSTYLPAPTAYSQPSLFFPSFSSFLSGAGAFAGSGFGWLQVRSDVASTSLLSDYKQNPTLDLPSLKTVTTPISINVTTSSWATSNLFSAMTIVVVPAYLSWVFLGPIYLTVVDMVNDRTSKLKEYLKIMGMRELSYWMANMLLMSILLLPVVMALSVACFALGFFGPAANGLLGMLIFFLFAFSSMGWALFVGAIAPTIPVATTITVIFFVTPFVATMLVNIPLAARLCLALLAPVNFQFVMIELVKAKVSHALGPVREVPSALTAIPEYPIAAAIAFFIIDTVLYTFLAWYFAQILGGSEEFGGAPKKWYFLFTKSYWVKDANSTRSNVSNTTSEESIGLLSGGSGTHHVNMDEEDLSSEDLSMKPMHRDPAHFEPYHGNPADLRIRTRSLIKRYKGADVNAVNGLDLDVFQGIYVLLGENGSGKSTTISMLTGLIPLTNGTAEVDGADVSTQLDFVRNSISICPQHDLLSDRLSGAEHLRLFGRLKGVPLDVLENRIVECLEDVGLGDAGDKLVEAYSGGMKRSLSLAISLVAHSRVVFIDEASSGMDMEKRRTLWDMLLRKKKEGSTLVLTTHYMEEAEILGDRIGIMHRGNLVREGSLDFLKRELGYQIHTSHPKGNSSTSTSANVELLPLARREELPAKLKALEAGFEHVAVTTPNLEEVFVQLGKSLDKSEESSASAAKGGLDMKYTEGANRASALSVPTPRPAPRSQQVSSFWKKRARAESRNMGTILCFLLAPIIITALGLSIARVSASYMKELPKLMEMSKSSGDTLDLTFGPADLPLQIPYSAVSSLPWFSAWSRPGLDMKYLGGDGQDVLTQYLWDGSGGKLATSGGVAFFRDPSHLYSRGIYEIGIEYNATAVYSVVQLTNFINNAIAHHALYNDSAPRSLAEPILRVRSVPFPEQKVTSDNSLALKLISNSVVVMNSQFAYMICMAFAILGGLIGKGVTEDMEKQVIPQLQRIGMSSSAYWFSSITFNMTRITVSALLAMAIVAIFKVVIVSGIAFLAFAIGTLLQAWTAVVLSILISKLFTSATTAQRFIPFILIMLVIIPATMTSMFTAMSNMIKSPDNPLRTLGNITPLISPMSGLLALVNELGLVYTKSFSAPSASAIFAFNAAGMPLFFQFWHLTALVVILFIIERYKSTIRTTPKDEVLGMATAATPGISHGIGASASSSVVNDSSMVPLMGEEDEIDGVARYDHTSVRLERIWKRYPHSLRRAVVDTSLSVPRGLCFGLLGPNGAGKSTTISMLIGDVSPTGGSYSLDGIPAIGMNRNDLYQAIRLSCCLQTDSLYDDMSVKEHIEFYLSVRNDERDFDMERCTREIMHRMKLTPHANKLARQLSGGNKRKLCTALAALTFNSIVVLDEPSTGCDPSMRRTLWQVIKAEISSKALILTTHSMDEADAVCNKIAIMLNGQVVSLGTPQQLKAQSGGYELQLWLPSGQKDHQHDQGDAHFAHLISALEDEVLKPAFPSTILVDRDNTHDGSIVLKYDIGLVPSISDAFAVLHAAYTQGRFSDYSLSQMTLGTAYQRLVRQQLEATKPAFGA